jgi:imidazolonepropionase-like amidohydrolase
MSVSRSLLAAVLLAVSAVPAAAAESVLMLRGGRVLTGEGADIAGCDVLIKDGKIADVGKSLKAPPGARVLDVRGRVVTPGLIDSHSHLGVYPTPDLEALADGNEMTDPTTPEVNTEHGVWPQDPGFGRALAGGVTTVQILPGSANLIGGASVVLRTRRARTVAGMKLEGAPNGMKMAWGENPRRAYGEKGRAPATRMEEMAMDRSIFLKAKDYRDKWAAYEKDKKGDPPARDLALDTLRGVLDGKILVHCHCYRADEMMQVLGLAQEMGFKIRSFEHAVEAYKIRDMLDAREVGISTWADWWGFKIESYDAVRGNVAMCHDAGMHVAVHSDSEDGVQRLNQEAGKAIAAGRRLGIVIEEKDAIKWVTSQPAWILGIENQTGRLAPGLRADVTVWDRSPFSVYARAQQVYIDGELAFDRNDPAMQPGSDFELGHPAAHPPAPARPLVLPRFAL